jgi:hypothetical protein
MHTKIQLLEHGRLVESGYIGYKQHPMGIRESLYNLNRDTNVYKVSIGWQSHYYTVHNVTGVTELVNTNRRRRT